MAPILVGCEFHKNIIQKKVKHNIHFMKRATTLTILSIVIVNALNGQRGLFEKDSIANTVVNLRRDTVIKGTRQTITGTGTLIEKENRLFIVTASHVAKYIDTKGYIILKGHGDKPITLNIFQLVSNKIVEWKNSPNADVSLIELNPQKWVFDSGYLSNRFLPYSIFYDTLKSLSRETLLTTFGFPLGLGTSGFFSPLTYRSYPSSGLITLQRFDSKQSATFILLENPTIGGYSGGPVFDLGRIESGNLEMTKATGTICYGIVHGTISDETGGKIAAITPSFYILELFR